MNFEYTEEQQATSKRVAACLQECDTAEVAQDREALRVVQQGLADAGYWTTGLGPAGDTQALALAAADSVLARASASLYLSLQATRHCAGLLAGFGDRAAQGELIDAFATGEPIGAVALHEPDDDSRTTLRVDGDEIVLDGRKPFVTNGPLADWIAVFAQDAEDSPVVVLVRPDDPGVEASPPVDTLGLAGLAVGGLSLGEARLPAARVLQPGSGRDALGWFLRTRDLAMAHAGVGLMHRALEAAQAYAGDHCRGGREIKKRQEVGFKLAEMLTMTQTAEWLCCRAAWTVAGGDAEAATLVHCAKVFCAENAETVASEALQVMAGPGSLSGNAAEQAFRDAKTLAVIGTSSEIARMHIADALLARY